MLQVEVGRRIFTKVKAGKESKLIVLEVLKVDSSLEFNVFLYSSKVAIVILF